MIQKKENEIKRENYSIMQTLAHMAPFYIHYNNTL